MDIKGDIFNDMMRATIHMRQSRIIWIGQLPSGQRRDQQCRGLVVK